MTKWMRLLPLLCLLLLPSQAAAQSTVACTPSANPTGVVFQRSLVSWQQADFNAVDANKQPIVTDFFGEVRLAGTVVANFTIPKTSVTPVTGGTIPANCYETLLPAMTGLLSANVYSLTITARGPGGQSVGANTASFFLQGAPQSPGNLSLRTPPGT